MDFVPQDYKEPVNSQFMDFEEGENPFRVLGSAIMGWEYWTEGERADGSIGRKPVRKRDGEPIMVGDLGINKFGEPEKPRYFWAFPVYNFNARQIQVLIVKQAQVRRAMLSLVKNKKWGDPKEYNIVVVRDESTGKTEYSVTPEPKEALDQSILDKFGKMNINMDALYEGKYPFDAVNENVSPEEIENFDESAIDKLGKQVKGGQ